MTFPFKVPPDSMHWQCGRCDHWNEIRDGICKQCNGVLQSVSKAFRLHNVLTAEEKNFYSATGPAILAELRSIRLLLERKP